MFGNAFGWPHLLAILIIVILLFGAPKLPGLARSIGQSMRIFRSEVKTMKDENGDDVPVSTDSRAESTGPTAQTTATDSPASPSPGAAKPKP